MELIYESVGKKFYRDGDKLIKSFDESYSKANILNEALNQARVEETGLNIPKILAVTVVDGRWAIVRELIEGETLVALMEKHPEKEDAYRDFFVVSHLQTAGKGRARGKVSEPLLHQDGHGDPVRAAHSAHRRGFSVRQGQAGGEGIPRQVGQRLRLAVTRFPALRLQRNRTV